MKSFLGDFFEICIYFFFWVERKKYLPLYFSPEDVTKIYQEQECIYLDEVYIGAEYTKELQIALHAFKFKRNKEYLSLFIPGISEIYNFFQKQKNTDFFKTKEQFLITTIPVGIDRYYSRTFNQSVFLAKELEKISNISYKKTLFRIFSWKHQSRLDSIERKKRKIQLYAWKFFPRGFLNGKTVFLVDDIISTGSTVNEAAKILKEQGVKRVIVFALARGKQNKINS